MHQAPEDVFVGVGVTSWAFLVIFIINSTRHAIPFFGSGPRRVFLFLGGRKVKLMTRFGLWMVTVRKAEARDTERDTEKGYRKRYRKGYRKGCRNGVGQARRSR